MVRDVGLGSASSGTGFTGIDVMAGDGKDTTGVELGGSGNETAGGGVTVGRLGVAPVREIRPADAGVGVGIGAGIERPGETLGMGRGAGFAGAGKGVGGFMGLAGRGMSVIIGSGEITSRASVEFGKVGSGVTEPEERK